jgi:hypothetical protein
MSSASKTDRPNPSRPRWRFLLAVLVIAPFVLILLWECGHYARFGHFFRYGYHVDLVLDHSDIAVPGVYTFYCLRVTNYTLRSLQFEGIQLPWGITDGEILYHTKVEKWNEQTHTWFPVYDSAEVSDPSLKDPNTIKSVAPGRSIDPTSCRAVVGYEGVRTGDRIRLVSFTSYSKLQDDPGQLVFYSPAFVINEKSVGDEHKSGSDTVATRPETTALR